MHETALVLRSAPGPLDHVVDPATDALDACDFVETVRVCEAALPWVLACGDTMTARYLRYVGGMALGQLADVERGTAVVDALLASLPVGDDPLWRAKALALSAELALVGGLAGRAVEHLSEADDILDLVPSSHRNWLSATMATALALQAAGAYEEAEERLLRVLEGVPRAEGVTDLHVLPELVLLVAERAARQDLFGAGAAADHQWCRVLSLALRWRRAGQAAGESSHVLRAVACEALAWQQLSRHDAAVAAVGGADLLTEVLTGALTGRVEAVIARLHLAGMAARRGDHARAREHLDAGLAQAQRTEAGVWTFTLLVAQADVDVAEHGPHPALDRWRTLAQALLARAVASGRSLASEVEAHRRARSAARETSAATAAVLTDALTGVANRRGLDTALAAAAQEGRQLGACFVDVDRFKAVNDDFSHEVGDAVLRCIADLVSRACRESDLVARYGGDEFVVLTGAAADPRTLAARVLAAVAEHPWEAVAPGLAVTVSIGVADTLEAAAVLAAADAAMLDAKRSGRGRVMTDRSR